MSKKCFQRKAKVYFKQCSILRLLIPEEILVDPGKTLQKLDCVKGILIDSTTSVPFEMSRSRASNYRFPPA